MENGNGLTADKMIKAIGDNRGVISDVVRALGCSRSHFYVKLKQFPSVQQKLQDVREERHDHVESKMMEKIDAGDTTMIIFYLKTQCKDRGYVERQEVTGADNGPIVIIRHDGTNTAI